MANCNGCGEESDRKSETVPVGKYAANKFGLKNTAGNVWEWTQDCWHRSYEGAPDDGQGWGQADDDDCSRRALRGGSWNNEPHDVRSAFRYRTAPNTRGSYLGFRVARSR